VELRAGHGDLLRVDHDDEVPGVDVRRVRGLALAAQRVGDLGGEPPEGLALGVDEQPVALAVKWGGDVRLHSQGTEVATQGAWQRRSMIAGRGALPDVGFRPDDVYTPAGS
jgi:hypothetical protein